MHFESSYSLLKVKCKTCKATFPITFCKFVTHGNRNHVKRVFVRVSDGSKRYLLHIIE